MTDKRPLKLEFQFKSQPQPQNSDNQTTLNITPYGSLKSHLPSDFSYGIGCGKELNETLAVLADVLAKDVANTTGRQVEKQVTFTDADNPDNQVVINLQ